MCLHILLMSTFVALPGQLADAGFPAAEHWKVYLATMVIAFAAAPVLALAWAVTVGGVLQLVYQLPYLKKIGMLVLPRINFRDTGA
ncbi:hypothetical protein MJL30_39110, partial [Salmonella enterica subsp. enterica serovar Anatum]|nr:hypothetical protein [Salmonella enterica subsp. enterica serovar Anatum]